MGRFFKYFWLLFFAYFIFAHPLIIYRATSGDKDLSTTDGKTALIYLAISLFLWALILGIALYQIYKYSFRALIQMRWLMQSGTPLQAKIIGVANIRTSKNIEQKELQLEMPNLEGSIIRHKLPVNDSKPYEHRFEKGKHITVRVDPSFKRYPYIVLDGATGTVNYGLYLLWILALAAVVAAYVYFYQTESQGYGWRFMILWHPLIMSATAMLGFGTIFYIIFAVFLGGRVFGGKNLAKIKFAGIQTMARITNANQTGTYVNELPQVKFDLEFTDKTGRTWNTSLKKIVSMLDLPHVRQPEAAIFYLPDNPKEVRFADDINDK
ncbi:hypothetical protein SAMN05444266_104133 [Chitinophaga jiangningensis]|uniref:Uncharacterized protein n=1 Tax=Chitinophaga jiangningensis TaxID=1419482 RepID=A0A1M7BZD1_9BACT|nr:hypothetical protein [Chitinophaga jiangningensis]SHL60226.1 hypothetical protein SAMN05444266_104133 [Chitinophaga jiangningensis]